MKKIMIMGACSAIARETAKFFADDGAILFLVDLSESRLSDTRDDINALYKTDIFIKEFDATDIENHDNIISEAYEDAVNRPAQLDRFQKIAEEHINGEKIYMGDIHGLGRAFAKGHIVIPDNEDYINSYEEYLEGE